MLKLPMKVNAEAFMEVKRSKDVVVRIAVDSQGFVWAAHVHAANEADTLHGCVLIDIVLSEVPTVKGICADQGYRDMFVGYVQQEWECLVDMKEKRFSLIQ